ncbi:MAG TPA: carboxymuconolactone decarboxylase family protein [Acidimicrobiales bacterium]|nr:carboxymuconolactone decarboxylase family protein [Acidimicrobiales bacterium]
MPRLRQVARAETDDPVVTAMYDIVFGRGVDPAAGTSTGSEGNWWTTYALVPDVLEHAVAGFVLYKSPERVLDGILRELAQARVGWAVGSTFVYSQHVQALRGLHADPAKIAAVPAWAVSEAYTRTERAVLGFADAIAYDGGRVSDELFAVLHEELSDEALLELTYVTAMYVQHAVICRALRLEWDDRPEPVVDVDPPEGFDAEHYMAVGSEADAKQKLRDARR